MHSPTGGFGILYVGCRHNHNDAGNATGAKFVICRRSWDFQDIMPHSWHLFSPNTYWKLIISFCLVLYPSQAGSEVVPAASPLIEWHIQVRPRCTQVTKCCSFKETPHCYPICIFGVLLKTGTGVLELVIREKYCIEVIQFWIGYYRLRVEPSIWVSLIITSWDYEWCGTLE